MNNLQAAFEWIDRYITRQMDHHRIPGAALAIIDSKQALHLSTHGVANLDSNELVRPEHLFMTGSIGKSFTAIALLQLYDEGRLDLHAPVTDYLPWFEVGGEYEPITTHHLLTHTGGIIGVNDVLTDKLYDVWALRDSDTAWEPGSRYHYSNVGYKTLGLVLERIEGSTYGEIIRRRILDPLGMMNTESETTQDMRDKLVTGYLPYFDDRPWLPHHGMTPAAWLDTASGEGCICAPVEEQANYLRALMNRDPRLLSEAGFDLFTAKHVQVEPDHWYGYGIDRDEIGGHTLISHGGEMPGHVAYMFGDLDTGLGFVIMINCVTRLFSIALPIHHTLAAAATGRPLPEMPVQPDRRDMANAQDYAARYFSAPDGEAAFELTATDNRLFLVRGDVEAEIWQTADGTYVVDHPDFSRLPMRFADEPEPGRMIRHGEVRYKAGRDTGLDTVQPQAMDDRGQITGHYRTYGSAFTNFRIVTGWNRDPLFVMPAGEEWQMTRIDQATWRLNDTPETVRFETFVDGQAIRAIFSGCDYYRTFTR